MDFDSLLRNMVALGASDIHLKPGRPPLLRISGALKALGGVNPLTLADTDAMAKHFLNAAMYDKYMKEMTVDSSYSVKGLGRFRVNVYRQRSNTSLVLRAISNNIPTLAELGLPPVVETLLSAQRGLILVTGVTGSGKSSTLAALVDGINERFPVNIISIEDPIEFLHRDKRGSVSQREIGIDTESFASAFIATLRQDPDVIMVGELRDTKTMETAMRAAETGHLVLSTLHTSDAKETINRIIDMFPSEQQHQVRVQLSTNLNAVISQRLISRADGVGRVLACEVMIATAAIRDYILDAAKIGEIRLHMEKGKDQYGSQTFDQSILELLQRGDINEHDAMLNATSPNDLKLKMSMTAGGVSEWM